MNDDQHKPNRVTPVSPGGFDECGCVRNHGYRVCQGMCSDGPNAPPIDRDKYRKSSGGPCGSDNGTHLCDLHAEHPGTCNFERAKPKPADAPQVDTIDALANAWGESEGDPEQQREWIVDMRDGRDSRGWYRGFYDGTPDFALWQRTERWLDAQTAVPAVDAVEPKSVRAHARDRGELGGADAQALEHAITITERERDAALSDAEDLRAELRRVTDERDAMRTRLDDAAHAVARWRLEVVLGWTGGLHAIDNIGCAVFDDREPTREEMLESLGVKGDMQKGTHQTETFRRGTINRCVDCGDPIFGGPTRCDACVAGRNPACTAPPTPPSADESRGDAASGGIEASRGDHTASPAVPSAFSSAGTAAPSGAADDDAAVRIGVAAEREAWRANATADEFDEVEATFRFDEFDENEKRGARAFAAAVVAHESARIVAMVRERMHALEREAHERWVNGTPGEANHADGGVRALDALASEIEGGGE